ncbi:MAG TPA: DUF2938 domain-containing protein [Gemmatimonadaceae bacterium]|jgi:hypothetical protein
MISHLAIAIAIGVGATFFIDAWNTMLKRVFGIPSLNYCFFGRWVGHLPSGVVRHRSIGAASAKRFECALGWVSHYAIGVGLAHLFILLVAPQWIARPTFAPALLFGVATVVFPFFVLQPSLGLGIASAATPHPARARLKSLATHSAYGVGLYLTAWLAAYVGHT